MDLQSQSQFNNKFDNSLTERQDNESDSSSCKTQNEPESTLHRAEIQKNDSSNDVQDKPTSTHDIVIYKSTSKVVKKTGSAC